MTALVDMEQDALTGNLSPEDNDIYLSIVEREAKITERFETLYAGVQALDGPHIQELYALKETLEELNNMRAESLSSEERDNLVENLSAKEDDLPFSARMWLDSLRGAQRKI